MTIFDLYIHEIKKIYIKEKSIKKTYYILKRKHPDIKLGYESLKYFFKTRLKDFTCNFTEIK